MHSWRNLAIAAAAAICLVAGSVVGAAQDRYDGSSLVVTAYGALQGHAEANDTWSWKGIPYARPPVGQWRWRAPKAAEPWEGVRDATDYGNRCLQTRGLGRFVGDEDCLYLNVWRPRSEAVLPVFVWIHGGSNTGGSGQGSWYTAAHHYDAVVVSINYRLGPLGWFAHPALKPANPRDASGNYGTLDQIAALSWVRENIESFGGDPDNVTLAGESAGAQNVSYVMHSPLARDLFDKAIIESNYPGIRPVSAAHKSSKQVLYNLLAADDNPPYADVTDPAAAKAFVEAEMRAPEIRKYLEGKSGEEIIDSYWTPAWGSINWGDFYRDDIPGWWQGPDRPEFVYAIGDGHVLPDDVSFADFSAGRVTPKPTIVGVTRNENNFWNAYWPFNYRQGEPLDVLVAEALEDDWLKTFGPTAEDFMRNYKFGTELIDEVDTYLGAHLSARNLAAHSPDVPVYVYRFDWGSDPGKDYAIPYQDAWVFYLGAPHTAELNFFYQKFFDMPPGEAPSAYQYTDENLPGRQALSRDVRAYLMEFIHNADGAIPETAAQPIAWRPWTADHERFIVFDAHRDASVVAMNDEDIAREPEALFDAYAGHDNYATVDFIAYYVLWSWHWNWFPESSVGSFDTAPGPNPLFDPAEP